MKRGSSKGILGRPYFKAALALAGAVAGYFIAEAVGRALLGPTHGLGLVGAALSSLDDIALGIAAAARAALGGRGSGGRGAPERG